MESVSTDLMQDPGVKGAFDKLQGFRGEITAAEKRITDMNSSLGEFASARISPIDLAAEAVVAGKPIKDIGPELEKLQRDLGKDYDRLGIIRRAAELQRKKFAEEEDRASREICERIEPEYRKNIARLARIMIHLGKAKMADVAFFDALESGRVKTGSLRRMNIRALGDPMDRNSSFAMWFQEAIAFGLVDEATVPAEWIERWNK